ncbi:MULTISPECIES: hypothetical protein [unclassified Streptomyces]|uniref:hypothetical protein n=1 Tax=unclassified Streptomyces TaxID=2593676 RepID=UPI002DDA7994|nr:MULTISPECIES: hypothetical protein [unclassified Streptomyces]WSB78965.1 hypothetical protein OHB04_26590 [Streptomyces sp. NBC_01775]WSS12833.1 hypothetical protein OG533_13640 [Streptomyces sp. NBC_01186]WSS41617.1 hypothetical protein OG220_14170 [Streptomyces sp. NBC_01187]
MHRLRRLLRPRWVHAGAWTLATGAAVAISWFGVHTVLSGTSYDPPRALPVSDAPTHRADPQSSSTHRPRPRSPSPSPSRTTRKPGKETDGPRPSKSPTRPAPPPSTASTGTVKGTTVPGGRAVFDMGSDSATLVSATPDPGWDMRVWNDSHWIRVTFTNGDSTWSVFCRWEDSNPRIETYNG